MKLSDNEKRDLIRLIEAGEIIPEKFRFLLFEKKNQIELTWKGKSDEITNVVLPFHVVEHVDEPRTETVKMIQESFDFSSGRQIDGWSNKLIWGDNKYILSSLKNGPMRDAIEKEGGLKLIYIDPPFDTAADFSIEVNIGEKQYHKKQNALEHIAYSDTWGDGEDSFLSMIYERLILMKSLLSSDGSIFVHCDWRLNSSLRLVMDEVFGNYINEIALCYTGPTNQKKNFPKKHDTILYYAKDNENYTFNVEETRVDYKKSNLSTGKSSLAGRADDEILLKYDDRGKQIEDYWTDIRTGSHIPKGIRNIAGNYPTLKDTKLLERIIKVASNEGDLIADFFSGSGTLAEVAEKNNRKWICSDLGKFAIHTTRKRMITTQRNLKKEDKSWRSFEVLNLGKYQTEHYLNDGKVERDINKKNLQLKKERDFEKLIIDAYQATKINSFKTLHAKKGDVFVSIGPVNQPISRKFCDEVINECLKNKITKVEILGFETEMNLFPIITQEANSKGLRLNYKTIPMEVFPDIPGEGIFYDPAYIEVIPHIKKNKLSVELLHFKVFYSDTKNAMEELPNNKTRIYVKDGEIIESKNKNGKIEHKNLTENWHDWIDYWSVDFDFESKKEIISKKNDSGEFEDFWTGNFIFENEWQSYREENKDKKLMFKSSEVEVTKGKKTIAVKVVDIFGNDTMKILSINI